MVSYSDFYERVKALAKSQNKQVRTVIENCGINYNSYNTYKRYGNFPRAEEATAIAKSLNTSVEYLVTGERPKRDNSESIALLKQVIDNLS